MIKVREAVIVEGKYDKIKLSSMIDGLIIETKGFGIFKDKEQMALIRRMADTRGILVLTDSDGAGFVIRNYLSSAIDPQKIKHAYIPDILGKERRKEKPSKEGKLGVEGVPAQAIREALTRAGVTCGEEVAQPAGRQITKVDLFEAGLSGGTNSVQNRAALLKALQLPEHLAPNSMLRVLNVMLTFEEFHQIVQELHENQKSG